MHKTASQFLFPIQICDHVLVAAAATLLQLLMKQPRSQHPLADELYFLLISCACDHFIIAADIR